MVIENEQNSSGKNDFTASGNPSPNWSKENTNTSTEGSIKFTEVNSTAKLFQNAPNPFNKATVIRYSLPSAAKQAVLSITSISGVKIKDFDLKNNKTQNVEINGGELVAGTYVYSLMVDGIVVDSKQMVLTR